MEKIRNNEQVVRLLDNSVTAEEVGNEFTRGEYMRHSITVVSPGDSPTPVPVQIQVSGDGDTWFDFGDPISSPGFVHLDGFYPWVRAARDNTTNPVTVLCNSGWNDPR